MAHDLDDGFSLDMAKEQALSLRTLNAQSLAPRHRRIWQVLGVFALAWVCPILAISRIPSFGRRVGNQSLRSNPTPWESNRVPLLAHRT